MHTIGRFILKTKKLRFLPSGNNILSGLPTYCVAVKTYHSEDGVYGHKPTQQKYFEGICLITLILNLRFLFIETVIFIIQDILLLYYSLLQNIRLM